MTRERPELNAALAAMKQALKEDPEIVKSGIEIRVTGDDEDGIHVVGVSKSHQYKAHFPGAWRGIPPGYVKRNLTRDLLESKRPRGDRGDSPSA